MKIFKNYYLILVIFILLIYRNNIYNILANINFLTKKSDSPLSAEITILKNKNAFLEEEIKNLTNIDLYTDYNYSLTRLSYRELYNDTNIKILNNKDKSYAINNIVLNNDGLVGVIRKVNKNLSDVTLLPGINNLSVRINDCYGTLTSYQEGLFKIENLSNYDNVHLNDKVYTSSLGSIKEKVFVGEVIKIDNNDINKVVYMKSNVDFNNLSYLYVVGDFK